MIYAVRFTEEAKDDLMRLIDFLAVQDLTAARHANAAISEAVRFLTIFPFSCRKAEGSSGNPFLRELLIPFAASICVAIDPALRRIEVDLPEGLDTL